MDRRVVIWNEYEQYSDLFPEELSEMTGLAAAST